MQSALCLKRYHARFTNSSRGVKYEPPPPTCIIVERRRASAAACASASASGAAAPDGRRASAPASAAARRASAAIVGAMFEALRAPNASEPATDVRGDPPKLQASSHFV